MPVLNFPFALVCALCLPLDQAKLGARYQISVTDPETGRVDVRLELNGLAGSIDLALPESFAFVRLPAPRLLGEVRVHSSSSAPPRIQRSAPYRWRLDPDGAEDVELGWTVPLDHRSLPEIRGRDEYEFPYLDLEHGLLVMGALALAPEHQELDPLLVEFDLPEGWPVAAPWPEVEPNVFAPQSGEALHDELIAIGHWDLSRQEVSGMELTIAFAPGQDRLRDGVLRSLGPIVEAELELFGSVPNRQYLFLFGKPQSQGFGGSPKSASMTLFASPDLPVDFAREGLEHLIAHEFHHTWMRARCEPEAELRFVSEGFTDWYSYLVPWRLGMRSDQSLKRTLGEQLAAFEQSRAAAPVSLAEAGGTLFFEGGAANQMVYAGGLVLAALTDLAIRSYDPRGGLDQLMRDYYEDPRWKTGQRPVLQDFLELIEQAAGAPFRARFERIVGAADKLDLVEEFAVQGVTLVREHEPADLSLKANLEGARVMVIDSSDVASRIGLRAGDLLKEVNGRTVSNEQQVREAWSSPRNGRFELLIERPSVPEPIAFDLELPVSVRFTIESDLAGRLRP